MSKHTPGPWVVDKSFPDWVNGPVVGVRGTTAPVAHMRAALRPNAEVEANARLIAAAPELLDALKDMMEIQDSVNDCWCIESEPQTCEACRARAAIAKATGGNATPPDSPTIT